MNNRILKVFAGFIVVCIMIICIDCGVGITMNSILPSISKQGQNGVTYFSLNEVNTPIVVVGASTASHHYDTKIIADSLHQDVYNIGRDGCFFSYNSCVINSILDRYSPEIIIWETSFKSLENADDPLESLYPYYGKNKYVTEYVNIDKDWKEQLSLKSNLYKYNSNILRIMLRYVRKNSFKDNGLNGYLPLSPKKWEPSSRDIEVEPERYIYDEKVKRFKNTLTHAKDKGTRIIVVESPSYMSSGDNSQSVSIMKSICDSMSIEYYDLRQAEGIYDNIEYWVDYNHLNSVGAEIYTKRFLEVIE